MIHETMLHHLTINRLGHRLGLNVREVNLILLLCSVSSLSTPSIHRLTLVRKSDMNCRIGPKLIALGWLASASVFHVSRSNIPTNRWWMPEDKQVEINALWNDCRQTVIAKLGEVLTEDCVWDTSPEPSELSET